jgi:multicomponent Na+:H+ antiporter subunit D
VVLLTDLFSLYVFLEVTSVASFVLIAFNKDLRGIEGAFKYLILSAVATILMLTAIALFVMVAGGTSFSGIHDVLRSSGGKLIPKIAIGAFICGLFIKGGLVPFHGWLPDAYSAAPAPVSVLLAGIVTKVSGIYALIRLICTVLPGSTALDYTLMFIGTVSIVIGALAALGQKDLKRLLAYSSISQVGYIILGLGCGTELAVAGAVFHLFNHSIFKSLLFVNSASLEQRLGTTDMSKMGGLGARMPVTSTTNVIALLSTAGVPPFAGFWSKLIIIIALWQAGYFPYAVIAILMSVVTLGYLLTMQRRIFFGKVAPELAEVREASATLAFGAVLLATITTGVGLAIPWLLSTFILPLKSII